MKNLTGQHIIITAKESVFYKQVMRITWNDDEYYYATMPDHKDDIQFSRDEFRFNGKKNKNI